MCAKKALFVEISYSNLYTHAHALLIKKGYILMHTLIEVTSNCPHDLLQEINRKRKKKHNTKIIIISSNPVNNLCY